MATTARDHKLGMDQADTAPGHPAWRVSDRLLPWLPACLAPLRRQLRPVVTAPQDQEGLLPASAAWLARQPSPGRLKRRTNCATAISGPPPARFPRRARNTISWWWAAASAGLSAAYFYRKEKPDARILILENHDDFGGHAKRNEYAALASGLGLMNGGHARDRQSAAL